MRGDFSRPAALDDRKRHYTTVFMQQGRVTLDADWNEQQQIHLYHRQTGMSDLVGASGAPSDNAGFEITVDSNNVLTIGAGRYYVDGMLAENDMAIAYHQQPYLADPPTASASLVQALDTAPDAASMLSGTETGLGLVYLDVWSRHITAWDDSGIREQALGGPDTTTRAETLTQVRILPITTQRGDIQRLQLSLRWQTELEVRLVAIEILAKLERRLEEISREARERAAELSNRERDYPAVQILKEIEGRLREKVRTLHADLVEFYRSGENERAFRALRGIEIELDGMMRQLYTRIQELVRADGDRAAIASLRYLRGEMEGLLNELHIQARPRREEDEEEELRRLQRTLSQAARRLHVHPADLEESTADRAAVTAYQETQRELLQTRHTVARQAATVCQSQLAEWDGLTQSSTGTMQARVEHTSGPNGFRQPDNQLIRVEIHQGTNGTGQPGPGHGTSFKWARDNASVVTLIQSIDGPKVTVHDVGPDGVRGFGAGQWAEIVDQRTALNGQPGLLAQIVDVDPATQTITLDTAIESVNPDEAALANLQIRRWDGTGTVEYGTWVPLEAGIQVQFAEGTYATGDYWSIVTRSDGIEWPSANGTGILPQPPARIEHHRARLSLIALQNNELIPLADGRKQFGAATEPAPAIHVDEVQLQNGHPLSNDSDLPVAMLAQGISIVCDGNLDPASVSQATCFVTLDVPLDFLAIGNRATAAAGDTPIGFLPLILAATEPIEVNGETISWRPSASAVTWLEQGLFTEVRSVDRVLARLTLKGNFIWDQASAASLDPQMYLDGEAFGRPGNGHTALRLPSGDGRPGGDFEMWFWLAPGRTVTLTVAPGDVAGQATVKGTVMLSGPPLREDATIRLHSNEQHAVVPESVTIRANETRVTFDIQTLPVNRVTRAQITATYEAGESATQTLTLNPLLNVASVRILDTQADPGAGDFAGESFELTSDMLGASPIDVPLRRPNALEVHFGDATLDGTSVQDGQTVMMETLQGTTDTWHRIPGQIEVVKEDPNVIRWMAHPGGLVNLVENVLSFPAHLLRGTREELDSAAREGAAPPLPEGQYRFTLVGAQAPAITSTSEEGHHLLDGEPLGLPSGDQVEGGDFTITLHIGRQHG